MNFEFEAVKDQLEQLGHVYPSGARRQWGFTVFRTVYGAKDDDSSQGLTLEDLTLREGQKTSTTNTPDWEALWQALISTIYARARVSVLFPTTDTTLRKEPAAAANEEWITACQELASLFHLEVKDDRAVLEGKTMQQVREIVQQQWVAEKAAADAALERRREDPDDYEYDEIISHAHSYKTHVFLYVDEQVLLQFRDDHTAADFEPWIKVVEVDYEPQRNRGNKRYGPQHYFGAMAAEEGSLESLWTEFEGRGLSKVARPLRVPVNDDGEVDDEAVVPVPVWDGIGGSGNNKLGVTARVSLRDGSLELV